MGTIADKLNKILGTKSAIRQAIVDMGQSVIGTASFSSYAAKIRAISSDSTAAAGDILSGKTAYAGGRKITGTIPGRGRPHYRQCHPRGGVRGRWHQERHQAAGHPGGRNYYAGNLCQDRRCGGEVYHWGRNRGRRRKPCGGQYQERRQYFWGGGGTKCSNSNTNNYH